MRVSATEKHKATCVPHYTVGMPHSKLRATLAEPPVNSVNFKEESRMLQSVNSKQEKEISRPLTTPNARAFAPNSILADWAELRIGTPLQGNRVATSQSMNSAQRDPWDWSASPDSRRLTTRGGKLYEADKSPSHVVRPATRGGMSLTGRTASTAASIMSHKDADFEIWQECESTLPAHFRLKASPHGLPKGRMSNIHIHLPEHTPVSFVASKSLQFLARYKEASMTKHRVGSKSLRLQKILELLADIATAHELSCPALGCIHKDLACEIFSNEFEGHDSGGDAIPMTWHSLCGNLRRELEDLESKRFSERSQNEELQLKIQTLSAAALVKDEQMRDLEIKNDMILLEQKARFDEVQKQKIKLEELSSSHQQLEAAFWSSDVTRRAYKSSLVHEANIQMNTQQYVQKSEDAFQQLLTVHKETLAKAHEIQRDSYAKDDLMTKIMNENKEMALMHTRQEGLMAVYQDRVNNSVAKTIYDAIEDDLTRKNVMLLKLEEQIVKLNSTICLLEKELEIKAQKGKRDGRKSLGAADLMKSLADFNHTGKPSPGLKEQNASQSEKIIDAGVSRDEVGIPHFVVDGLSRRPGRVGRLPAHCQYLLFVTTPCRSHG